MGFLSFFLSFILTVCSYFSEKKMYYPNFILGLLFTLSIFISLFNINGVIVSSWNSYFIVAVGILSFYIGSFFSKKYVQSNYKKIESSKRYFNSYLYVLLVIICLFSCFFWIADPIKIILRGGSIGDIYNQRLATEFSGNTGLMYYSGIKAQIIQYICLPLVTCLIPASIVMFFDKFNKKFLFISILLILIYSLATGGRTQIVIFAVYFSICYFILKTDKKNLHLLSNKRKRQIYGIGILLVFAIIYVFSKRGTEIIYTLIAYCGYPIAHMDKRINTLIIENTLGMSTFQGFIRPLVSLMGLKNPHVLDVATNFLSQIQNGVMLSQTIQYNAFVTPFFFFYADFAIIGVVLFSALFGFFSDILYRYAIFSKDKGWVAIFILSFASPICFSLVRFQYVRQEIVYGMLLMFIIFSKHKIVYEKN